MSIAIPNFTTGAKVVSGLNTYTYTIQNAGVHYCRAEVDHRNGSAATISIAQSGSRSATLATTTLTANTTDIPMPQSTAIVIGAANFAANDTVTFTISSSAAADKGPQDIKARLLVTQSFIA